MASGLDRKSGASPLKLLVANRGEIAVRILRACREMGLGTVAVYSDIDRDALHVRYADEAYPIGPAAAADSYLRIDRLIEVARRSGARFVHPGYGFLAENPAFARACRDAGLIFVGPPAEAMEAMGDKVAARERMRAAGVPVLEGSREVPDDEAAVARLAEQVGYPVLLKAAAGGGGRGMRVVRDRASLPSLLAQARGEAQAAFGDSRVFLERYLEGPRHIEVQILADAQGRTIHLGERECSIQRRHQKLIEESPSPVVDEATRGRIGELAVRAARAVGYAGAGTVEFLRDRTGEFYFMEMNTRLQVEHPVTEVVYGVDLVKAQIRIAAGEPLPWTQEALVARGHAIECRILAEDPARGFMPCPGTIQRLRVSAGPGIRDDSGIYPGCRVPLEYDPLLAKLIAWGADREEARRRMIRALEEYRVEGVPTTIPFHRRVMDHPAFARGEFDTGFVERYPELARPPEEDDTLGMLAVLAAAIAHHRRLEERALQPPRTGRDRRSRWKWGPGEAWP